MLSVPHCQGNYFQASGKLLLLQAPPSLQQYCIIKKRLRLQKYTQDYIFKFSHRSGDKHGRYRSTDISESMLELLNKCIRIFKKLLIIEGRKLKTDLTVTFDDQTPVRDLHLIQPQDFMTGGSVSAEDGEHSGSVAKKKGWK